MPTSDHNEPSYERQPSNPADVASTVSGVTNGRVRKKRVRNFTADDRAAHRVFEKSRREAFKERLTNLASLLPTFAETDQARLSKHVIVDESIAFIESQHSRTQTADEKIQALIRERDELLEEVNQWRSRAGIQLRQANNTDLAITEQGEMAPIIATETSPMATYQPVERTIRSPTSESMTPFIADSFQVPVQDIFTPDTRMGMPWESYGNAGHAFDASQPQMGRDVRSDNMTVPEPLAVAPFQGEPAVGASQFATEAPPHEAMFPSLEPSQTATDSRGFQNNFVPNSMPIQNYMQS